MLARPIFAINTEVLTNRGRMSTISSGTRKINAFNFRAIEIANFADIVGVTTSTRGYIYQDLTHHSVSFPRSHVQDGTPSNSPRHRAEERRVGPIRTSRLKWLDL